MSLSYLPLSLFAFLLAVTLEPQYWLPHVLHAHLRMPPELNPKSTSSGLIFGTKFTLLKTDRKEDMLQRMREPALIALTAVDLLFSVSVAHLLVYALGWRYTDWIGLNTQPFDASASVLVYTVLGAIGWPILGLLAYLAVGDHARHRQRQRRRKMAKAR